MKLSTLLNLGIGCAGLMLILDVRRRQEDIMAGQAELQAAIEEVRSGVNDVQAKIEEALVTGRTENETLKAALAAAQTAFEQMVVAEDLEDVEQHAEAEALRAALAEAQAAADTSGAVAALTEIRDDLASTFPAPTPA